MADEDEVKLIHIALCCNKSSNCLDVGPDDIISFGSSHLIALYRPYLWGLEKKQFIATFNNHRANVICTRWLRNYKGAKKSDYLLSGAADGSITCWKLLARKIPSIEKVLDMDKHTGPVRSLNGIFLDESDLHLIASASADSTVKLWLGDESFIKVKNFQTIDFKNGFVHDLTFHCLPYCNAPILACASDDFTILLYSFNNLHLEESPRCQLVVKLRGHEDWVRGVDFISVSNNAVYLASCSQDSYIRLWKICSGGETNVDSLQLKKETFRCQDNMGKFHEFSVSIDAVLSGHENWVYSVRWHKRPDGTVCLLSSSIDKTVVIWNFDKEENVWIDEVRVGEIGGNTLGFYGAQFSANGQHVVAHSYSGALHGWDNVKGTWNPAVVIGGHASVVNDIAWEPKSGRYLISIGEDQTTRLFAKWTSGVSWHETARPQIHGYDLQCLAMINGVRFVSGADEKVLRVFEASKNFLENMLNISGERINNNNYEAAEGATVPALGLSNKAVSLNEKPVTSDRREQYIDNLFIPAKLHQPPPETYLLQNTLWPETRKVYGHVYEIFCLACNHTGTFIASASKASQAKHASIFIWDVTSWKQLCSLSGHALTVTQMEFSPDDSYFLSVSRDRTWILHKIIDSTFTIVAQSEKKTGHSRIIWSCSWSHDSKYFATASRDKKVMVWKVENCGVEKVATTDCKEPATAVAFANQVSVSGQYILAIGHESGKIKLSLLMNNCELTQLYCFNNNLSHCLSVKRLQWRPCEDSYDSKSAILASCGADHQVKIYKCSIKDA